MIKSLTYILKSIPKVFVVLLILIAGAVFGITENAQAGSLNSAEQNAISEVSQPFEYNGDTYVVSSSYISQASSKLSEDGVDLTEQEANDYLDQFRNSYQELVEEGYCTKLYSSKNDKNETKPTSTDTPEKKAGKKAFLKNLLGDANKDTDITPSPTLSLENTDGNEWSESENVGDLLEFSDEDRDNSKENKIDIKNGDTNYTVDAQDVSVESDFMYNLIKFDDLKICLVAVIILSFICIIGQILYILIIKNKKKKNRKIRFGIATVTGISAAGWAIILISVFAIKFGFMNYSSINRQLMESDYYLGVTQMVRELGGNEMEKAGYDTNLAEDIFALSNVYIEEKQYISQLLKDGEDITVSTEKIHENLVKVINKNNQNDDSKLIEKLEDIYVSTLKFALGKSIVKCEKDFMTIFIASVIAGIILLGVMVFLLNIVYGYKHKTVRIYAIGSMVASLAVVISAFICRVNNYAAAFNASPVYYEDFLQKYVDWGVRVFLYIGLIGVLVSIALFLLRKYLHKLYVE